MPNLELFFGNPQPAGREMDAAVRAVVSHAIATQPHSRQQLAEHISRLAGVRVTAGMLNDFTAASKRLARFPAAWVPAFCQAAGDDSLQRLMLSQRLLAAVTLGERVLLAGEEEIALEKEIARLRQRLRAIREARRA
jgi:hypothetical protein